MTFTDLPTAIQRLDGRLFKLNPFDVSHRLSKSKLAQFYSFEVEHGVVIMTPKELEFKAEFTNLYLAEIISKTVKTFDDSHHWDKSTRVQLKFVGQYCDPAAETPSIGLSTNPFELVHYLKAHRRSDPHSPPSLASVQDAYIGEVANANEEITPPHTRGAGFSRRPPESVQITTSIETSTPLLTGRCSPLASRTSPRR